MTIMELVYLYYLASILVLSVSVSIALWTYPLQRRQAKKHGKYPLLRDWFLKKNETIIGIGTIAIIVLGIRFIIRDEWARLLIGNLVFLFSLGFLRFAVLNRKIWKQEYLRKI